MQCPGCKHETPPDAQFCPECGAKLAIVCARCGVANAVGHKFCKTCGQPLTVAPVQPPETPRFGSIRSYTPTHLAERILTSRGALEGERKQVTVLFADLKGSLELLADRDPEEARKLLDPVLERMMEAVHRYEGTVNQVMGDGIMALFGAPLAHEDHAVRACYAALRMQESVKQYAEGVRRVEGITIQIRVGLNSGEVVVRSIGSDLHIDYTAVGQTTHLSARMEQLATPGTILVTPETARLVEGYVQVRSLGPFTVKGLREPLELFEVVGVGPARTRLQVAVARGLTRFVGREAELTQLRQALDRAMRGHGQVVAVVGEPGVGKSRLFHEFKLSRAAEACLVLETVSASYGRASTYLPLIELLRGYFRLEDRDDPRRIREKVTGKVLTLERGLEDAVPLFIALLAVDGQEPDASRLDPKARRARTFEALKRLLIRESEVQPVVLIFEDLHWADNETRAFLDFLVEGLLGARVLLLVNHRPELKQAWGPRSYLGQIWLEPLAPESASDLLEALLGPEAGLASLKGRLLAQTGGNPLFLEEGVRALVETGVLVGERGAYRATREIATVQIPGTVQAIIAARIDRLAPEEKALLQLAAVIGEEIPLALLARVAEESEEALRPRLSRLQEAEFLYEARLFPEIEFTFRHGLTREVAYESLLAERRRAVHGRIAATIEALYPDRLAEHLEALAQHYQRHEAWEKALGYLISAGDKASAAYGNQAAIALYTQGLEAAARSSTGEARVPELCLKRGATFYSAGNFSAAAEDFERALDEARRAADRRMEGEILYKLAAVCTDRHHTAKALWCAEQALAIAEETGARTVLGGSLVALGRLHVVRGALAEAEPFALKAVQEAEGMGEPALHARALGQLAGVYRFLGKSEEALISGDRALALARGAHDLGVEAMALYRLAQAHCDRGEYGRAMAAALEGCRLGEAHGERYWLPRQLNVLGGIYGEVGAYEPAVEQNRKAAELARRSGEPMGEVSCNAFLDLASHHLARGDNARGAEYLELVWNVVRDPASDPWMQWRYKNRLFYLLGTFWLGRADAGKAGGFAADSVTLAEQTGAQKNIARSHLLRGEMLASEGKLAEAATALQFALEVARRTSHRPLVWRIRAALGRLLERQGKRDEARGEYGEAMAVVEAVVADVPPSELRSSFLSLPAVQAIRERLDALPRG